MSAIMLTAVKCLLVLISSALLICCIQQCNIVNAQLINVPPASQPLPPTRDAPIVLNFDIDQCLNCICLASSLCSNHELKCNHSSPSNQCGAYKLSFTYWADAGALSPHSNSSRFDDEEDFLSSPSISLLASPSDFEQCAISKDCARRSVKNYFLKYAMDCNNDAKIDCQDMAAIHRAGSAACSADWIQDTDFWHNFQLSGCLPNKPQRIFAPRQIATPPPPPTPSLIQPQPQPQPGRLRALLAANESRSFRFDRAISERLSTVLTADCFDCLCESHAGCNFVSSACNEPSTACGPFGITRDYWLDAQSPGNSWFACTRSRECSQRAVLNYMQRYAIDCDGDGKLTCADIGAIHARGADECKSRPTDALARQLSPFFDRFDACLARARQGSPLLPALPQPPPPLVQPQQLPPSTSASTNGFADANLSPDVPRIPTPTATNTGLNPTRLPSVQPDDSIPQQPPTSANFFKPTSTPAVLLPPTSNGNSDTSAEVPRLPSSPFDESGGFNNLNGGQSQRLPQPLQPSLLQPPQSQPSPPSSSSSSFGESDETPRRPTTLTSTTTTANNDDFGFDSPTNSNVRPPRDSPTTTSATSNSSSINAECFECICEAATSCNLASRCQSSDVRNTRCGLFLISFEQWSATQLSQQLVSRADLLADAAASERAFYACATTRSCGEQLMAEIAQSAANDKVDCNGDGRFDCYDLAAVHQAGKAQCSSAALIDSQYWSDFNACFGF